MRSNTKTKDVGPRPDPRTFSPHKYQEKAIEFLVSRSNAGLFLSPGLGKTSITLASFKILQKCGFANKLLVIAPLRPCYSVWPAEVKKWEQFSGLSVGILHGPHKLKVLNTKHDIYVINPEGLRWLFTTLRNNMPFDMLVVDESSKFKNTNTDRFKTLKPYLPRFKRRVILTGSPAPNSLLDIFGQMYILDLGKTLSSFISHFRANFFNKRTFDVKHPNPEKAANGETLTVTDWYITPEKAERLYAHIAPNVLRMSAEDYLDIPPLIINDIYIDLPPKARLIYDQFDKAMRLDFKAGRVTAANAAIRGMKARQIANGGVFLDDSGKTWEDVHFLKAEVVQELVEELEGSPALVAYEFQHDLARLKKMLGVDTPHIGGGVKGKQSQMIIDAWNRGELPVLLGQPSSMAHGLNMQESGDTVIFHSMVWNFEDYDQFIKRVHRQGKTRRVTLHRIIARDTVDEAVVAGLARKDASQNSLFTAIRDYWN